MRWPFYGQRASTQKRKYKTGRVIIVLHFRFWVLAGAPTARIDGCHGAR
jgi:hypothetical protein